MKKIIIFINIILSLIFITGCANNDTVLNTDEEILQYLKESDFMDSIGKENLSIIDTIQIDDSKIVFSYIKNDNKRSIINIMREEVYGIHDFILIIDDIPYSIDHTVYNTIIKNENNAVYEFLTFYRKEEQV